MKALRRLSGMALALAALASASHADGRNPGSLLVFPVHHSGGDLFTVVSVTNSDTVPDTQVSLGGSTDVLFEYVNIIPDPANSQIPLGCSIVDRLERLTPADTLSVLTTCHNASGGQSGYLVVTATDPSAFKEPWSFNRLIGSELVVSLLGGAYSTNAIPFRSPMEIECLSDKEGDDDGVADFDGREYEEIPDDLYIDNFIALTGSSLVLIDFTGFQFRTTVHFDVWNDDEFPLSATTLFRCWMEEPLNEISLVFSESFLAKNTPNDPQELDINCDGLGDLETGWALIRGVSADSSGDYVQNPALLGAITSGDCRRRVGGRLLWESKKKQDNGVFRNFSIDADNDF